MSWCPGSSLYQLPLSKHLMGNGHYLFVLRWWWRTALCKDMYIVQSHMLHTHTHSHIFVFISIRSRVCFDYCLLSLDTSPSFLIHTSTWSLIWCTRVHADMDSKWDVHWGTSSSTMFISSNTYSALTVF